MKTIVIQLEIHDDVISIKDKMAWQSCQRMILVWPKRGRILNNELELVLLSREAKNLGSELALVTHHPVVCEWALDSNLPLFASISAAEKEIWKRDLRGSKAKKVPKGVAAIKAIKSNLPLQSYSKPAIPQTRWLALLLSSVALLVLILVLLPQAEVTYFPIPTMQEININIKASEVFSGINPSGNIPEKAVFVEVNGEKTKPSSGKNFIPTTKAVGKVMFTNLTHAAVTLPIGTLLFAGKEPLIGFKLVNDVTIPSGLGNTAIGEVEALLAGDEGNMAAESNWMISGGMDSLVSASNPDAISGGDGVEIPSPNEEDYAMLERQLLVDLMTQGLSSLKADQTNGVSLIEPSLSVDKILLSEQVNPIGDPADEAVLRMNVRLKIYTYQISDLLAIADLVLISNQPKGSKPLDDTIHLDIVGDYRVDDFGQADWSINATRLLIPDWDTGRAAVDLSGMKVSDARIYLSNSFAQSSPVEIKSWFSWMPLLSTNIHFVNGAAS